MVTIVVVGSGSIDCKVVVAEACGDLLGSTANGLLLVVFEQPPRPLPHKTHPPT